MKTVITHIMPAPDWYALFHWQVGGSEDDHTPNEEVTPLVGWALTRSGNVVGLATFGGDVDVVDCIEAFAQYIHVSELSRFGLSRERFTALQSMVASVEKFSEIRSAQYKTYREGHGA